MGIIAYLVGIGWIGVKGCWDSGNNTFRNRVRRERRRVMMAVYVIRGGSEGENEGDGDRYTTQQF